VAGAGVPVPFSGKTACGTGALDSMVNVDESVSSAVGA
jgi:hypothetical protein